MQRCLPVLAVVLAAGQAATAPAGPQGSDGANERPWPPMAPARRAWGFLADDPTVPPPPEATPAPTPVVWMPRTPSTSWASTRPTPAAPPSTSPAAVGVVVATTAAPNSGYGWAGSSANNPLPTPAQEPLPSPAPPAPVFVPATTVRTTVAPTPPSTTTAPSTATLAPRDDTVLQGALAQTSSDALARRRRRERERLRWTLPEEHGVATCPSGYYRTSLIVLRCGGGSGMAHILLPPPQKMVELQEIPAATVDFQVMISSHVDAHLILWDKDSDVDISRSIGSSLDRARGTWSGVYRGMHITCGEEDGQQFCRMKGTVPHGISLRIITHHEAGANGQDSADLRYEHHALGHCSGVPYGCSAYDRHAARIAVLAWSRAMQLRYKSPVEAWSQEARQAPASPKGIPWHEWVVVWHFAPSWQLAFRFLDLDKNNYISPMEFAFGYNLAPVEPPATTPPSTTPRPAYGQTTSLPRARVPETTRQPPGLTDRCPAGYYRSSALLFSCSGGRGLVRFNMPSDSMDKATTIPKGVKNLKIMLAANVDVDMYLWDLESNDYVVHWKEGTVNDKRRVGVYKGATFSFSGDDRTTPIIESCNVTGVSQAPLGLRLYNYAKDRATANLYYAYDGLTPCHAVPAGCKVYNRMKAEAAAMLWSQQIRRDHSSAEDAWDSVNSGQSSDLGISWHDWVTHWDHEEKWKMVFRFLDVDGNGHISIIEFSNGYALAEHGTGGLLLSSSTPRPVVTTVADVAPPIVIDFPGTSTPRCFDGQYRVNAMVFHCSGHSNRVHWSVAAKATNEVQQLPVGLTDLYITLSADDDVDLYLWDQAANRYILHWRDGFVNDQRRSGNYEGLEVSFSGDDKRAPTRERYALKGRLPVPVTVRLENFGKMDVEVIMEYTYQKLDPCPAIPVGCNMLNMAKAEQAVMTWSQQERSRFPNAHQAWAAHIHTSMAGLPWHSWKTVAAGSPDWKLSFRYLDTDNDGYIGEEEFVTGYHFSGKLFQQQPPGRLAATTKAPVPTVSLPAGPDVGRRPPSTACPAGYYQSVPVVFGCTGGSGSIDFATEAGKVREVMYIPSGVHDVLLQLTADVDVDLYVWDASSGSYIVHWEEGVVSEKVRGGRYHELSVSFSGDDRTPPIHENCKLAGTISRPVSVRLHNRAKEMAVATLHYTYGGLIPCQTVPDGCERYDPAVAKRVAAICARQLHSYHFSAEGAWDGLVDVRGGKSCVPRQNWRAACSHVDLSQAAFRYLDRDNDGCLSKVEFTRGFHLVSDGAAVRPSQKLKVSFPLPNLDYKKLAAEPEVRRHLKDAIRLATVSACHNSLISQGSVNVNFGDELLQKNQVEAVITPPPASSAESIQKYCCSPTWLNSNMRRHIAQVKRVHRVFVGRITHFRVSCQLQGDFVEDGIQRPIMYNGFGPVDFGVACMLFGALVFAVFLLCLVNLRSSYARLHAWSLINVAADIFSAALVFAAASEFVRSLVAFTPILVRIAVDYSLFLCAFALLQAVAAILSVGFSTGGSARGGVAVTSTPLDTEVWVIADPGRADCGQKVHTHEVRSKNMSKSVASVQGAEVFVKKACYERDQEIRRIRRYTAYISYLAGFAAMHAGCSLQRMIIETHRTPTAVLIPVLLNQVLLYGLFRVGRLLRSSWERRPLAGGDGLDGILRDPKREALLDEEILGAEGDIASLACSFLLVQALHFWVAGVVPGLDRLEEELERPLDIGCIAIFAATGAGMAIVSIGLAQLSLRQRPVSWKRRLSRVWVNTTAMCSAWCILWAVQWELHRRNGLGLPAVVGELAAQLLLALVISVVSFTVICMVGKIQDASGPDKMIGAARSGTMTLAILVGVSWRLAFGAAAAVASEDAPQPAVTRLLFASVAALLVLPAANRHVLAKVMRYKQMQADILEARGESALAEALMLGGAPDDDDQPERQTEDSADDSNVWRFYRRQEDDPWQRDAPGTGADQARLQLTIMHAAGLRNADWMPFTGKSDPYCTCEIPGKPSSKVSTYIVNDDLNPVWNYSAEIMDYTVGESLVFTVYDSDMTGDDLLGRATLLAPQFYPGGFEGALPLMDSGKAVNSTLTVKVKVAPALQQPALPGSSQLQLAGMQPMRSGGWYTDPSGKDIRPLG